MKRLIPLMAERMGFEPTEPAKVHSLSRGARSTALAPFHFYIFNGGEIGIRTLGTLRHTGFQDQRFRPLSHLSIKVSKFFNELFVIYCFNGSPDWIRTSDQMINSHLLYRWATEDYFTLKLVDFIVFFVIVKVFYTFFYKLILNTQKLH